MDQNTQDLIRKLLKHERELKSENITLKAVLNDIFLHSREPFVGEKWTNYIHDLAKQIIEKPQ